MKIIFDNNIWISFLIGKRLAELRTVFTRQDIEIEYQPITPFINKK